ncbi:AAA family ATPase [Aliarcobacter cryaerophilus]|uniref:AAA family ATPase n=1 Tax=Aliarcobacter cryaerophilus TaxID=28198 RepID=UPI0021B5710C|nr:ATP-binding protein [Aliarcobacter cryaerophilus]MCT7481766.1 ATP-binding protein [Aliarcobacter cryaerophilus]
MFKTGSPVKGNDFIDRKKHLPIFKAYLENNQHVMIKAPRRFGKTSLIKQVFEHEKSFHYIYVDLRRATNLTSLANQILEKAYSFAGVENFMEQFKKSITGLLKTIQSIKIDDIGEITLKHLENGITDEREYFLHSLDVVEKISSKKELNIKFVLDEFQDILRISDDFILEQMRSVIQHHEAVTYVFLGSIESIMTNIFSSKASPFFLFARIMSLDGLDIDELYDYTKEVFDKQNIKYDDSLLKMLQFLQGHPDYSAQVLQALYYKGIVEELKMIDYDISLEVLTQVILENRAYLEELISKTKQKKHHYEVLHSIANGYSVELNSKSLYNIHSSLEEMGLIKNIQRGQYAINDIFLEVLLQQKVEGLLLEEQIYITNFKH